MGGAWGCSLGLWVHQCERVSIGRGAAPQHPALGGGREWCLSGEGAPGCEGPGSWHQPAPVISMVSFHPSQWAGNGPRGHHHHQVPLLHLPLRQDWELLSRLLPTQTWGELSRTVDCAWPTPISTPDQASVAFGKSMQIQMPRTNQSAASGSAFTPGEWGKGWYSTSLWE